MSFSQENFEQQVKAVMAAAKGRPQKKNNYYPKDKGFESQEAFLTWMCQTFNDDVTADYFNIQAMLEDAAFVSGQQWDPIIMNQRILDQKPTLTINTAPALIAQVMGNRLLNETAVRVLPDMGGTKDVAKTRQGLIRSIEKISNGDRAYDVAMQNQVIGGMGNFRVTAKYAASDVFDQELGLDPIPNPGAVVWDRLRMDPTGRDARHVYVQDLMLRTDFEKRWPWAQPGEVGSTLAYTQMLQTNGWMTVDLVRVVDFYHMCAVKRTIAMLNDGSIVDVTDKPPGDWINDVAMHPTSGAPIMRETMRPYCEMVKCSATNVLEGPFRYWTDRVLVFRVPGWEINVGDTWNRFGLIRFAKDPMRYRNFWKSVKAEKMMQTPRATWLASQEAVAGYEQDYRNSNVSNDPLLRYNAEAGSKPERLAPVQVEAALIQEASEADQDIRNVTNLHEASLGQQSNEVSGKAINARVRIGELGTVIYQHNLNMAIGEAGRVLNDLIPYYYDTPRMIKVLGEDGKSELVRINDPEDPESIDITVGKYQVTVTTGPSYTTKRVEAAETMETIINAHPEIMGWAGDILFRNLDIPGGEELAERAAKLLPPELQDMAEATPEQKKANDEKAQATQHAAKQADDKIEAEIAEARAKVDDWAAKVKETQAREALLVAQRDEVAARIAKMAAETQKIEAEVPKVHAETEHTAAMTQADLMATAAGFEDAKKQVVVKE
jgi:hypothetical protein